VGGRNVPRYLLLSAPAWASFLRLAMLIRNLEISPGMGAQERFHFHFRGIPFFMFFLMPARRDHGV
jgi:hypothetical protein